MVGGGSLKEVEGRVGSEGGGRLCGGATWWKLVCGGRDTSYGLEENWEMDKVFILA